MESKQKGKPIQRAKIAEPSSNVVDLMAVLKKSLASTGSGVANENENERRPAKKARGKKSDARQRSLLLPIDSGKKGAAAKRATAESTPRTATAKKRKRA